MAAAPTHLYYAAVACQYGSYRLLSDLEAELGYSHYNNVASSFRPILDDSVAEKVLTLQSMAYHFESSCSSKNTWPNCGVPLQVYEYLGHKQLSNAGLQAAALIPVLTSEQV